MNELIRRAREGDCDALDKLLALIRPIILAHAKQGIDKRITARLDASDVVQSTLLKVAEAFPTFGGATETDLRRWLKALTNHTIIDVARHHVHAMMRTILVEKPLDATRGAGQALGEMLSDSCSSPSENARNAEQRSQINDLIGQLPPRDQAVITLRALKGYSLAQVATELNMTVDAVAQSFGRAMIRLRGLACSKENGQ